ncbi:hypothetical protein [Thermoproteus tenax]|nr:hypothetical protein [Thermoproteus tenax]
MFVGLDRGTAGLDQTWILNKASAPGGPPGRPSATEAAKSGV